MPPSRSSELATSGGVWDWNPATNRIHFSPRWFALLGCDERELGNTREAWLGRVHPNDVAVELPLVGTLGFGAPVAASTLY